MLNCPKCDAVLDVEEDDLDEADEFSCEECGAELVVAGLNPLEVKSVAEADDEDEADDDFDDDDEDEDEEDEDEDDSEDW